MSDEIKQPGSESPEKKHKSGSVVGYLVILFIAAFLLLLMAYFMQQRATDEKTINTLRESITSIESLDELIDENQALRDELEQMDLILEGRESELSQKNEELQRYSSQQNELLRTISAWEAFYEIEQLYLAEDYEACAAFITNINTTQHLPIPTQAAQRYEQIVAELNEMGYLAESTADETAEP